MKSTSAHILESASEHEHIGDWPCPLCGTWASTGCDHVDPETDNLIHGIEIPEALLVA